MHFRNLSQLHGTPPFNADKTGLALTVPDNNILWPVQSVFQTVYRVSEKWHIIRRTGRKPQNKMKM
jgi:hypothetical protein